MSRTERLFALLQILRQHRYAISGKQLAAELGVSLRTVYRDIATLQAQGADIEGEPGLGFKLRPGFMLPPLMFSEEELEALVLGSRWVARRADATLKLAANKALAKISAVLPGELRHQLESAGLLIGPGKSVSTNQDYEAIIRQAMRKEIKLYLGYMDVKGQVSLRTIWPLALGFFEETRVMVAWCELRQEFRHFRTDRITSLKLLDTSFHPRRQTLLQQWRNLHSIPEQ
ncbi:helix-turn-helix transcriptional regulator [Legionella jordanis]|uniref:Transcription regulator protein, DeoR family n=1 Tax=Legionella jordanis TaxID=456 RepID=A0A0W0VBA8_9GAMM|nr:YafY family protein [Legionella jordanis]KTD17397.1 transcription regulator protein, DeoR family [Legionella jordanis]RMX01837.1 YafY family transcriptional regulator [Legionella jordanis]RMX15501.1 YafY family transcriptional regulator [Legionella jordanis]VEH11582.1 transcription regulator protein, DeoR family [Legionella jordanis]HAT8714656.1 HTH domain-containing protein [Legionella jordanis]